MVSTDLPVLVQALSRVMAFQVVYLGTTLYTLTYYYVILSNVTRCTNGYRKYA